MTTLPPFVFDDNSVHQNIYDDDDDDDNDDNDDDDDADALEEFQAWSCDDITPDLCKHLQVESGAVEVDATHTVSYWKYFSTITDDDDDHTDSGGNDSASPLVIIPGGPAIWPHDYLTPLKQQACPGGGRSTQPRTVYFYNPSLNFDERGRPNNLGHFANVELPALLDAWNLTHFSLLGHGMFGGMVALKYAIHQQQQQQHVHHQNRTRANSALALDSLILLSTTPDLQLYYDAMWDSEDGTFGRLPPFVQERIHTLIHREAFESSEYQALVHAECRTWLTRTWPPPDCVEAVWGSDLGIYHNDTSFIGEDFDANTYNQVVDHLFGRAHDFMLDISAASLAGFNVTDELYTLTDYPILVVTGEFDSVRPIVVDTLIDALPIHVERLLVADSGHLTMIDQPEVVNNAIGDFLERVDGGYPLKANESFSGRSVFLGPWLLLMICIGASSGTILCLLIQRYIQESRRRTYELVV